MQTLGALMLSVPGKTLFKSKSIRTMHISSIPVGLIFKDFSSRNSSGKWIVSFHKAHLDSMHSASGGHVVKLPCVQDLDGTAHIRFCETGRKNSKVGSEME